MEEKSNVSRVQKSMGSYRFRIEGYSGLSTKIGESVESPEFFICNHLWQLRIFPGGSLDAHKGYLSYYLASKSSKQARASYKLSVINQIAGGEDEQFSSSGIRIFEAKGVQVDGWGRDKFMPNSMLADPEFGFCVEDVIIFKVEITVYGELETSPFPIIDSTNISKLNGLDKCLIKLLDDPKTSDMTIYSGINKDKLIAHKCILMARSPVFYAMLSNNMLESCSGEVYIPDIDTNIMKEFLHYIYTDAVTSHQVLVDHSIPLLTCAIKYDVVGLVDLCENYYYSHITVENVLSILKLADTYGAINLKHKSLQFIAQNASKVQLLEEFHQLEGELLTETNTVIDAAIKRKGCRGIVDKDRRFHTTCAIM